MHFVNLISVKLPKNGRPRGNISQNVPKLTNVKMTSLPPFGGLFLSPSLLGKLR
ncbi:MAG: hypothetical protein ACTS4U_01465 [Candidatus Hodgkinia cicadicola]